MDQIYKIAPLRQQLLGILERHAQEVLRENDGLSAELLAEASGRPIWAVEAAMASARDDLIAYLNEQNLWCLLELEAA
jgi:DNA-directed RNA polymerase specialized sigma24 family protein